MRPTTISTTPVSSPANRGVSVGKVPAEAGTVCLRARLPAMASAGTMSRNLPASMDSASVELYQSVFPVRPPKADPLLFDAEVKA